MSSFLLVVDYAATLEHAVQIQKQLDSQLKEIVGLESLKEELTKFAKRLVVDMIRRQSEMSVQTKRPVMVFSGNPGTGKTSVAKIVASEY